MDILYNNVNITNDVTPLELSLVDNAGGKPDSVESVFLDTQGLWSKWNPHKNDTLQIKHKGYDTGLMYIDELSQNAGKFNIKALSIPQHSKTSRSQGWENVRLLEIVNQIASRYGFAVKTYNIINHLYPRADQIDQADFDFLAYRCMLEGYALKIHNKTIVIYDEYTEEQKTVDQVNSIIYENQILRGYTFKNISTEIYQKCIVKSNGINGYIQGEYSAKDIFGPTLNCFIYCNNQAEANRFSKGMLRYENKKMISGSFNTQLNTNWAAGSNVEVKQVGMFDGKYFINKIIHDLINSESILRLRKPLEGY
jgi:hypothetical protein